MAYDLRHTGEAIDAAVYAVERGSVVTENTVKEVTLGEAKPASADAIAKELQRKVDKVEGKGLSTNDYTNEEKEQLQNNTSAIAAHAKKIAGQGEMLSKHSEDIAKNAEDIAKKANTTEYYPAMAVGVADNLRGRGEATEEEFTYRPSAGASNSISEEGVATMKRIKGNSLVWNNKIKNGNFDDNPASDALPNDWENGSYHITLRATISYPSTGGINFLFDKGSSTPNNISMNVIGFDGIIKGHKYLLSCDYSVNGVSETSHPNQWLALGGTDGENVRNWLPNTNGVKTHFETIRQSIGSSNKFAIQMVRGYVEGAEVWLNNIIYIDLTQMFGSGNEPTTIEDFYARIPEGVDINAYNEGQIISMNANAIETTGFNQWDEQWVNGYIDIYTGNMLANKNRIASANFCRCLPNTEYYLKSPIPVNVIFYSYSKNIIGFLNYINNVKYVTPKNAHFFKINTHEDTSYGTTYNNDICINLSHSGVRSGEYESYVEHNQDFPEIARYFPDGMKSVGGVFDEMNEHEAVQRVGQRAYAEGDNDNPAVMTDGVNTVYPLDTPIVTPMPTRAINLNYPVWDWGTERAVSDAPSAPFRADIIYGFNAVDTIRTNKFNIEDILRRLAELEAKAVVEQSVEE